jgi:hypothetical protein
VRCRPVAQRFGHVRAQHAVALVEIGDGARDAQHAMIAACREQQPVGGAHQHGARIGIEPSSGRDEANRSGGIGDAGAARGGEEARCRSRAARTRARTTAERSAGAYADKGPDADAAAALDADGDMSSEA